MRIERATLILSVGLLVFACLTWIGLHYLAELLY